MFVQNCKNCVVRMIFDSVLMPVVFASSFIEYQSSVLNKTKHLYEIALRKTSHNTLRMELVQKR